MNWFWSRPTRPQIDTCASLEPLLSLFSDGMASPPETRRVEAHLVDCAECRRALEWMQATRLVIAKRPVAIPPPDLRLRIAQAIAAGAPLRPAPRRLALRPAFAMVASVALVAAVGVTLDHALKPSPPNVVTPPNRVVVATVPHPAVKPAVKTNLPTPATHSASERTAQTLPSVLPHPTATPRTDGLHVARVPDDPAVSGPPMPTSPVVKTQLVRAKASPSDPVMAKSVPVRVTPQPVSRGPVQVAVAPTDVPLHNDTEAVVTPSAPSVAPTTTETVRPEPTHTEVAVLTPTPPTVREDVLSHVRTSLAAFSSDRLHRSIIRNDAAHVQAAAFTSESGGFPPFVPTNYTPGLNSKKDRP